jgi:hypothetical protein
MNDPRAGGAVAELVVVRTLDFARGSVFIEHDCNAAVALDRAV